MTNLTKIKLLGSSGRHDVCSTNSMIYPAKTPKGSVSLFKTLLTNACSNDCYYCANRHSRCTKRSRYSPPELARTFINFHQKHLVEGLFLSSGIGGDPDLVMTEMIRVIELLRNNYSFDGYVHLKILPGTNHSLINQACELADRVSINLESTSLHLPSLSPDKDFKHDLLRRLNWVKQEQPSAGVTTQLVVGGAGENDQEILELTYELYNDYGLKRVYYSAFSPIKHTPLSVINPLNPLRQERLYEADSLIRDYGFRVDELVFKQGSLPLDSDPKLLAALHDDRFPIEINDASFNDLIRVPGIGPVAAERIINLLINGFRFKSFSDLPIRGDSLKRAAPFLILNGIRQSGLGEFLGLAS